MNFRTNVVLGYSQIARGTYSVNVHHKHQNGKQQHRPINGSLWGKAEMLLGDQYSKKGWNSICAYCQVTGREPRHWIIHSFGKYQSSEYIHVVKLLIKIPNYKK
jgi:hypothetical protein